MALAIAGIPLGPFQTNCYILRVSADATDAVVVDPGSQGPELIESLDEQGINPVAILVTHCTSTTPGPSPTSPSATSARCRCAPTRRTG